MIKGRLLTDLFLYESKRWFFGIEFRECEGDYMFIISLGAGGIVFGWLK